MTFTTLTVAPGIFADEAPGDAEGRYVASDMVRFYRGRPQSIGGWQTATDSQVVGVPRGIIQWANTSGQVYVVIGTHRRVMVLKSTDLYDITPLEDSGTLAADPITTVDTSNTVTIAHVAHGLEVNQEVVLSGATATGGITADQINTTHTVTGIPTTDTYTIEVAGAAATSSATGGGASVDYEYLIVPGVSVTAGGFGWGAGTWGASTWGTVRDTAVVPFAKRNWSFALYGEDLLMVADDHKTLYRWDTSAGVSTRPVAVTNAPACEQVLVNADTRQVIALGGTDRMQVAFSDKNDLTDWTSTSTNSAGSVSLAEGSRIIAASQAQGPGRFLLVSDQSAYLMSFIGGEIVYRFTRVGSTPAPLGPNAIVEADGNVVYLADGAVMSYSGGVLQQLPCPLIRSVFNEVNRPNSDSCYAARNAQFNEWLFFYRTNTTAADNDKCLVWHAGEGATVWSTTTLDRSAYTDRTVGSNPIGVDASGNIYKHEIGTSAAGGNLNTSLTTADVDLPDSLIYDVTNFIPDFVIEGIDNLSLTFKTRISPLGAQTTTGPHVITPTTDIVNVRATGRQVAYTVSSSSSNIFWRSGASRVQIEASEAER